jgi:hypothetical protein
MEVDEIDACREMLELEREEENSAGAGERIRRSPASLAGKPKRKRRSRVMMMTDPREWGKQKKEQNNRP